MGRGASCFANRESVWSLAVNGVGRTGRDTYNAGEEGTINFSKWIYERSSCRRGRRELSKHIRRTVSRRQLLSLVRTLPETRIDLMSAVYTHAHTHLYLLRV